MPSAVMKRVNVIYRCKAVKVLPNNKHKTEKEAGVFKKRRRLRCCPEEMK